MKQHSPIYLLSLVVILLFVTHSCKERATTPIEKEIKIIPFGRFQSTFADKNDRHLSAAKKFGIPFAQTRDDVKKMGRKLSEIESNKYYQVDPLTHSVPYLVPRAEELLETIGREFADSLESRGVSGYTPIVTSVLRTGDDVRKLTKSNGNASPNSAHCFGTTFDIAYSRFGRTNTKYEVPEAQIKHLLAEVLRSLQRREECYVLYEIRQGCFHITTR